MFFPSQHPPCLSVFMSIRYLPLVTMGHCTRTLMEASTLLEGVVYTCWRLTNCIPADHVLQDPYLPSKRCDNYLHIMPAVSQFCHLTYCSATEKDTSLTLSFVVRCTSEHEYSLWRRLNWHQVYLNTSNACAISQ